MITSAKTMHPSPRQNGNQHTLAISVSLLAASVMDCELLSAAINNSDYLRLVDAVADVERGFACIERQPPHFLVVDPRSGDGAVTRTVEAVLTGRVRHAFLLDCQVRDAVVGKILPVKRISYLTRRSGMETLLKAIAKVAREGCRVFDPALEVRIHQTARGCRLTASRECPSVARLTVRELQVMELLARGFSVRESAAQLQISESTVDNHKTRLMKKLRLHKTVELAHLAIRDGLIEV